MSKPTFYQHDNRYIMATGKAPKGLNGVVAIVWEGALDNLKEAARSVPELQTWDTVKPADIPDDWWNALASASGIGKPRPPKPVEPKPKPKPEPERRGIDKPSALKPTKLPAVRIVRLWEPGPLIVFLFWLLVLLWICKG